MSEKDYQFSYKTYLLSEANEKDKALIESAFQCRTNAYVPYSHFGVGAAILLDNGQIVLGNNQENAAYPSGLCAERVAIYQASTQYPDEEIEMIAISGSAEDPTSYPVSPCGACRQSLSEYETKQKKLIPVYFMGAEGEIVQTESIKDLLPFLFDGSLM